MSAVSGDDDGVLVGEATLERIVQRTGQKHKEVLEREKKILTVTKDLLGEVGYLGLTMDRIAEKVGCSKPTIYQHFSSKEEVMMVLARQNMQKRITWYKRAARFDGCPRERMVALGVVSSMIYRSEKMEPELILSVHWIRQKVPPAVHKLLLEDEATALRIETGIVEDAVAAGDLELPGSMRAENVVFALWSLHFGGYAIQNVRLAFQALNKLRFTKPSGTLAWAGHALMDGFGWRPLSSEFDYSKTVARVREEFFGSPDVSTSV
jgi:AcrR family transcriptional regulator